MKNSGKKVTLKDISEKLGISKMTVSLALRSAGGVSKDTRKRVMKVAREMGYKHNRLFSKLMSQIKKSQTLNVRENIALINANISKDAFVNHPTIPQYILGIRRAALRTGFAIDEFWLHDPKLTEENFAHILKSRGINGGIIVGLMHDNNLQGRFSSIWRKFKFVVTGVRTYNPTLDYACTDHFLLAYRATKEAIKRGYKRPALILDEKIDELIEGRFAGGFLKAQLELKKSDRIDPFFCVKEAKKDISIFHKFFLQESPDCIISLYNTPRKWLEEMGIFAPRDIGLIQLEWRENESDWAGMNQRNDLVGEAVVSKLSNLLTSDESSEKYPITATLVSPEWVESKTLKQ